MKFSRLGTAVAALFLAAPALGQSGEQYLDVYIAQVKPEKRAEFDALSKKTVTANRQNKGDIWLTTETVYGPGNRVTFISTRNSYAEAEKGAGAFDEAMQKTFGKAAADKMSLDFNQCLISSRSELRRRRWDLSSDAPADASALAKLIGESRWLRTTTVHVKPGQVAAFEGLLKDLKAAREKASPPVTTLVSQAVAGQEGTVFYVTVLQTSLAGFDSVPTVQQILNDEGYAKFLRISADAVENTESVISRFLPELSNAPEQVIAVAPDFWQPKTVIAKTKAKAAGDLVNAAEKVKTEEKDKH